MKPIHFLVLLLIFSLSLYAQQPQKSNQTIKTTTPPAVSKSVTVATPGALETLLTDTEKKTVTALSIWGDIDDTDFKFIRMNMPALKSIDLKDAAINASGQSPAKELPSNAFSYMRNLVNVVLPSDLKSIGNGSFEGCAGLQSLLLPASVEIIGEKAFSGCGLKSVIIPSALTSGVKELSQCLDLKTVTVSPANTRYSIYGGLVYNYSKDTLIFCPRAKTGPLGKLHENLKIIETTAFYDCRGISGTLVLPASLREIKNEAFASCRHLTGKLSIPASVQKIGDGAFTECDGFTEIYIPVVKMQESLPEGCFVGHYAFDGCNELKVRKTIEN